MDAGPLIAMIIAGLTAGAFLAFIFRHMPAAWLLDYQDANLSVAKQAQRNLTFFPGILLLMLADGLVFAAGWLFLGTAAAMPAVLYIAQPLLLIIVSDLKTRIIPDQFVLALLPGGVFLWAVDGFAGKPSWGTSILLRLLAGILGGFLLFLCGWVAEKIMRREAMGMGDVKLLAACAFLTGLPELPYLIFLAFITAAVVAIPLLIRRIWRPNSDPELAFGPYIALATMLVLLLSRQLHDLWQLYLGLTL